MHEDRRNEQSRADAVARQAMFDAKRDDDEDEADQMPAVPPISM